MPLKINFTVQIDPADPTTGYISHESGLWSDVHQRWSAVALVTTNGTVRPRGRYICVALSLSPPSIICVHTLRTAFNFNFNFTSGRTQWHCCGGGTGALSATGWRIIDNDIVLYTASLIVVRCLAHNDMTLCRFFGPRKLAYEAFDYDRDALNCTNVRTPLIYYSWY